VVIVLVSFGDDDDDDEARASQQLPQYLFCKVTKAKILPLHTGRRK
jgi:hypothetical protein